MLTTRNIITSSSDIEKRLKHHNSGKVKSTQNGRPLILHYNEEFDLKSEAEKRERFFKSIEGYIWLRRNKII